MCLKIKPDSTWTASTNFGSIAWPSIDMIVSWCSCTLISIGHCDAPPVLIVLNRYLLLFLTENDCNQLTVFYNCIVCSFNSSDIFCLTKKSFQYEIIENPKLGLTCLSGRHLFWNRFYSLTSISSKWKLIMQILFILFSRISCNVELNINFS